MCWVVVFAEPVKAELRGVIDDSGAPADLRADKSTEAAVTATLKAGESFTFECDTDAEWCKVTAASGQSGWIEQSRIRLRFTKKDLPVPEKRSAEASEIDQFAWGRGLDYAAVTRRAARGDAKALKQFFSLAQDADGAAAESISGMPTIVCHLLGDVKLASFLDSQPPEFRVMARNRILADGVMRSPLTYLRRHFPETAKVLFRGEIVDWVSPNGKYALHKAFSGDGELSGSKVMRAELIEKNSGRVLCDLTPDDIGTGAEREGEALWSSDSKRVACLSRDFPELRGNLFSTPRAALLREQTTVYQLSGEAFTRVDLRPDNPPGRESDTELQNAILGHKYTKPLRWLKPNVLLLQHHEYYEKLKPMTAEGSAFESIHPFDRLYEITGTIPPDGHATAVWKLRQY
ncbi:hypothetical protein BH18VER1_BH18VER1_18470 [soil metagenome]